MSNYIDYELGRVREIRESVRMKANEISHQIAGEDRELVFDLIEELDHLYSLIEDFDEVLDKAWNGADVF